MKKWFLASAIVLLASGCEFGGLKSDVRISEGAPATLAAAGQWTKITITKDQIYRGSLVLVNREKKLRPEAVPQDIVNLASHEELTEGYTLLDPSIQLSEAVAERFEEMVEAAASDGVRNFRISSGYRDVSEQARLYKEKGSDYALPAGHSEHNLGLSLDIGSTAGGIDQSREGRWLKQEAWDFGFILRYPKDKFDVTGIQYEPWHFRYVGLPHSLVMHEKNFVLEEYLAYLKEQKSIVAQAKGITYQISYVPVSKRTEFEIPSGRDYALSGNNSDGVIVTVPLKEAA